MYIKHKGKIYKEIDLDLLDKDDLKKIIKDLGETKDSIVGICGSSGIGSYSNHNRDGSVVLTAN